MRIHLIAIGGAIMHNLAMELSDNGHEVSGSDDAINEPALSRLKNKGLLPDKTGWAAEKITADLDLVILGMHAREDNPELLQAQQLGLRIMSFPEFMYEHAKAKTRVVIAGSHGKTTTTSMLMHILKSAGKEFDYLVGAQLEGYDNMVRLSDAPIAVFEGDEYTSSPLDLRPKFVHYKPHISIITGIAWDHINVFETHEKYIAQFRLLTADTAQRGKIIYYEGDPDLADLVAPYDAIAYDAFAFEMGSDGCLLLFKGTKTAVPFFGAHNFQNLRAAYEAARLLGVTDEQFLLALPTLPGPARRLEKIYASPGLTVYYDFAHAPSKVQATVTAICSHHENQRVCGVLELHTFSSIDPAFISHYKHTLNPLTHAAIYYDPETALAKKMPVMSAVEIKEAFANSELIILHSPGELKQYLKDKQPACDIILLMSSGNFGGLDVRNHRWDQ